ncbi:MAG TPA: hypothetical protein VFA39_19025 [Steroidobacteraceae bacterium]|nr:hypothetical protein [Steroidobacteraceae bacterium]
MASNLFGAGVVWGTVRARLAEHDRGISDAKGIANKAHERIDRILEQPVRS